jgi:hypothetical protein
MFGFGIPLDVQQARRAYEVFIRTDLPKAALPKRFVEDALEKDREWSKFFDNITGPLDKVVFTPKERRQANSLIVTSAGIILAFERLSQIKTNARQIFAEQLHARHIWVPLAVSLVGLAGGYYVTSR